MLSAAKKIEQGGSGGLLRLGVVALVACHHGGLAMLKGGFVRPARVGQGADAAAQAADAATSRVLGVFLGSATGGAANGDVAIEVQGGEAFLMKNSAGADEVTAAHVGSYCYVIDDETVASGSAAGLRPPAGVVREVGADGVMVDVSPAIAAAAAIAAA